MLDSIRDLLEREPFHPFRIVLTSGDRYEITDPHLIAIGESQIFHCYLRSDRFSFIRISQIAAVGLIETAA